MKLRTKLDQISSEIYEYQLNEDSNKEDVSTAGYVAKTLSIRSSCIHCKEKLVLDDEGNKPDPGIINESVRKKLNKVFQKRSSKKE